MAVYKILVAEDDDDIREGVGILLSGEGCDVVEAADGERAAELLAKGGFDLAVLDIMMPGLSGIAVCRKIREISNVPVLFLTAKAQESDKLVGFMAGGDDYLSKPFSYPELLGRVKALLRRYTVYKGKDGVSGSPCGDEFILSGGIKISRRFNEVFMDGTEVRLSNIEYNILLLLMSNPGKIFSSRNLYESVWNEPFFYSCSGTVTVHIRKLRVKIEADPQHPRLIRTEWGRGYKFEPART